MSTPLFQEALIEAKKLREAAASEAKNAVLEAVSPLIKQMIDREISGVILEQEEPVPTDAPPPAPPMPSPDAGAVPPVDAAPAGGAEMPPPPMPGMTPAVAKAAPPIVAPEGTSVPGKFETDPVTGQPQIVLNINDLFTKTAPEASMGTEALPAETPAPESEVVPPEGPPAQLPKPEETAGAATPQALAEIYRAVNRLFAEQRRKSLKEETAPPAAGTPPTDPAAAPIAPAPTAAAPVPPAPTAAPGAPAVPGAMALTPEQMMTPPADPTAPPAPGAAPPAPGATPPAPGATPPPAAPGAAPPAPGAAPPAPGAAPPAPGATPPPAAPVMEYRVFKNKLEKLEEEINKSERRGAIRSSFLKEKHEKDMLSLYKQLVGLRSKNAISSRVFGLNEERLDLLNENLNLIYSYTKNSLTKENTMKTKNSLRDFARSLFEGAEGFEKEVGHVDPAGDSEGGDAEHAHKISGNPKGVKAEAEKAKFPTKEKSAWPGKPEPTSILEQLEEEIAEMMDDMHEEDEGMHMEQDNTNDEAVLEMNDEEIMAEARKARTRLKALREQAEEETAEEGGEDDHLSLTIDLDGVSGKEVENVNVSIDGEELDVDMGGSEDMEMSDDEDMEMSDDEDMEMSDGEDSEKEVMTEARKVVRAALKPVNETVNLRKQLDETQLLTARSLYLNKLFVRDDLSGAQKRKIVEYLDSARTIAEAKEIYNRVTRVLNTAKNNGMMNESVTRPAGFLAESVEPSFDTSRWQILAGVKKTAK